MMDVEEVVENIVEEVVDAVSEDMEEAPSVEAIVEAIVSEVKEEMGYVKKKMAELEEKIAGVVDAPAAAPVMKQGSAKVYQSESRAKFAAFDVSKAKNADRIESAIRMMKNKK